MHDHVLKVGSKVAISVALTKSLRQNPESLWPVVSAEAWLRKLSRLLSQPGFAVVDYFRFARYPGGLAPLGCQGVIAFLCNAGREGTNAQRQLSNCACVRLVTTTEHPGADSREVRGQ